MSNPYRDKLLSIGFGQRTGESRTTHEVVDGRVVMTTTDHADGRVDAIVRPDVIRHGTRLHRTGTRRGQVAEVYEMGPKERRERYGDQG